MQNWPIAYIASISVALAACNAVAVAAAPVDQDKINAAFDAQDQCFNNKAAELDDGVSDAMTIATAVAEECKLEIVQLGLLIYTYGTKEANNRAVQESVNRSPREAAMTVLRRRSQARSEVGGRLAGGGDQHSMPEAGYDAKLSKEEAARGQLLTGAHLKDACEATDDEYSKCSAFVRGVAYAYMAGAVRDGGKEPYCLPEKYFAFQWTSDVVEFLGENPNFASGPAENAVVWAMKIKHPCSD